MTTKEAAYNSTDALLEAYIKRLQAVVDHPDQYPDEDAEWFADTLDVYKKEKARRIEERS